MKLFISLQSLLILMTLFLPPISSCQATGGIATPKPPGEIERTQHPSGQGTPFALSLYRHMEDNKTDNRILSPISLLAALAMVYEGAKDDTAKEMAQALWSRDEQDAPFSGKNHLAMLKEIMELNNGSSITLLMASRLWPLHGYPLLASYQEKVKTFHLSEITPIDFSKKVKAVKKINTWVEKETAGHIQNLIQSEMLKPTTRMVLTNAIYFKGTWAVPFDPAETRTEPFTTLQKNEVAVSMMNRKDHFNYMENEEVQAIELPYAGNTVSMILLLPKDKNAFSSFEAALSPEMLSTLFKQMQRSSVSISMPRFQIGSEFDLSPSLVSLGMEKAFSRYANFSGIDGTQNLFLSAVLHKARIEVNEKGAEAAAATAVIMFEKSAFERTTLFRADHPFLFMIRENKRGEILFLGRVLNPSEDSPL